MHLLFIINQSLIIVEIKNNHGEQAYDENTINNDHNLFSYRCPLIYKD